MLITQVIWNMLLKSSSGLKQTFSDLLLVESAHLLTLTKHTHIVKKQLGVFFFGTWPKMNYKKGKKVNFG